MDDSKPLEKFGIELKLFHTLVFGNTGSGKSHWLRYFLKKCMLQLDISKSNIFVFVAQISAYQWEERGYNTYTEWDLDKINEIKDISLGAFNKQTQMGGAIIVFDDFNEEINTRQNDDLVALYTTSRHVGIRMISVSHSFSSVGNKIRDNIAYAVIMSSVGSKIDMVQNLSKLYLGGDVKKLRDALKQLQDIEFSCLIIDKKGKLYYDKAPKEDESTGEPCSTSNAIEPYQLQRKSNTEINPSMLDKNKLNMGVSNVLNNSGVYNDASSTQYNISNNVNIQSEKQMMVWQHQKSIINYNFQKKFNLLQERDRLKGLLVKYPKSRNDINNIINLLRTFCQTTKINSINYEQYGNRFLQHYYPECHLQIPTTRGVDIKERSLTYLQDYVLENSTSGLVMDVGAKLLGYIPK